MASVPPAARRYSAEVNVLTFGADPTGDLDCTDAFIAAIAECQDRDYSSLYIPAGIYKFEMPASGLGKVLTFEGISGLCVRGDGSLRSNSQEDDFVGTTLRFMSLDTVVGNQIGMFIKACTGLRFEDLTIQGADPAETDTTKRNKGVQIDSISGLGTTGIQFQNCVFAYCSICVETSGSNNNSELSFYDCAFSQSHTGFKGGHYQAVTQKFIGCVGGYGPGTPLVPGGGMVTMFDLSVGSGNITVVSFFGANIETFMKVGPGGGNIGWNEIINLRLEAQQTELVPWAENHRIRLYEAADTVNDGGAQRTSFNGVVIVGEHEMQTGPARFKLFKVHEVYVWNISGGADHPIANSASKLLEFAPPVDADAGGTFRCYGSDVPFDARLDRDTVPAGALYSFKDCQDRESDLVPYPDAVHPPLYGPNYLMSIESHCWAVGDGLQGVNAQAAGAGGVNAIQPSDVYRAGVIECRTTNTNDVASLISATSALKLTGGAWHFQASVRVPVLGATADQFVVRLGFGDSGTATPANGLFFQYTQGATTFWQVITRAGGVNTATDTTTSTVNNAWHTFEIIVDASGAATFYIDGAKVNVTHTAPSALMGLMPVHIVRTAHSGDQDRTAEIDYFKYEFRPETRGAMYPQ